MFWHETPSFLCHKKMMLDIRYRWEGKNLWEIEMSIPYTYFFICFYCPTFLIALLPAIRPQPMINQLP
jgi:hypothetical protein